MAMGDSTTKGRWIRHIPDDRRGHPSGTRRADDARRRATDSESASLMDSRGETVTDIVDLLDAMFTDDEFHSDSRLLVTIRAADEIASLRVELAKTTQDLEDAKTLLADSLPRLVDAIRLRAENVRLRDLVIEWADRCDESEKRTECAHCELQRYYATVELRAAVGK